MNRLFNKSAISFSALGGAFLVVISAAFFIVSGVTHAGSEKPVGNGRILTIYDRGSEKKIISQAATIGDALKEANVSINEKDVIEPSLSQKMVASDYKVNIYRARPVIIIDGTTRTKIITAYQTPQQIAAEAGVKLFDEDRVSLDLSDDIITDGAGLRLTINRATSFTFTLYGKVMTARTFSKTVGEMLNEKGIKLTASDKILPEIGMPISEGLAIRVWREGKDVVNIDEAINFDTDTIEDIDQSVGYSAVRVAGENGNRSVSYEIAIQDGVEVGRKEIASIVTKQPKKQTMVIGVKGKYTTPTENENITWNYLRAAGFSRPQTAGIMGNLQQVHQFKTSGDGLAQWAGSRKAKLYSKPSPNNIYTQLDFLMEELNGDYGYVQNNIKSTDSLSESVRIFQDQFERCDHGDSATGRPDYCMEDKRIFYAGNILASHLD
jgi:uncharacterized protein YabE (DUF348 family)